MRIGYFDSETACGINDRLFTRPQDVVRTGRMSAECRLTYTVTLSRFYPGTGENPTDGRPLHNNPI